MDQFNNHAPGLESPASNAESVVPSDTVDVPHTTRAIYVGGAGDVSVEMKDGGAVTFRNVNAGAVVAIRVSRVLATGTTATDIVGLY